MKKLKTNYLAIVVVVIISQLVPVGWYAVFSDQWMAFNDLTLEFIENNFKIAPYITAIISSIAFALVMAWIFRRMKVESMMDGVMIGLIMGIAFSLLSFMTVYQFSYRPYGLAWIDGGKDLIIYMISGAILGGWRKYETSE